MVGKETDCSGAGIWVGWIHLMGVCERVSWEQVFYFQAVPGLGVGLDESVVLEPKG